MCGCKGEEGVVGCLCFRISKSLTQPLATAQPQRSRAKALTGANSSRSCPDNSHLGRAALGTCGKMPHGPPPTGMTCQVSILSYLQGLEAADGPKSRAFIAIFLFSLRRGILQFSSTLTFFFFLMGLLTMNTVLTDG